MSTPKRTRLTNKDKQDIVLESKKKGFRMEDAAKQYGVGLSTVYKIVQNGEKVLGSPLRDSAKTQRKASELHLQLEKKTHSVPAAGGVSGNNQDFR